MRLTKLCACAPNFPSAVIILYKSGKFSALPQEKAKYIFIKIPQTTHLKFKRIYKAQERRHTTLLRVPSPCAFFVEIFRFAWWSFGVRKEKPKTDRKGTTS